MKLKLIIVCCAMSPMAWAALPAKSKISTKNSLQPTNHEQALYEQLAGKPSTKVTASANKALGLARQSRNEKNYILAIKRYNFVLKYYPKTVQAKAALMDKASMYKEMGLNEPAAYNQKKVSTLNVLPTKNKPSVKR